LYYFPLIPKGLSKIFVEALNLFAGMSLTCVVDCLEKTIDRSFQVCLLAPRAAAWSGKAFSFIEHIPAGHAAEREHNELPFLCCCRQSDVWKMLVDFPFPNADGLGDFPGGHFFVIQEEGNLLADGLRTAFVAHVHPGRSESQRYPLLWICHVTILSQSDLASNIRNIKELILHNGLTIL